MEYGSITFGQVAAFVPNLKTGLGKGWVGNLTTLMHGVSGRWAWMESWPACHCSMTKPDKLPPRSSAGFLRSRFHCLQVNHISKTGVIVVSRLACDWMSSLCHLTSSIWQFLHRKPSCLKFISSLGRRQFFHENSKVPLFLPAAYSPIARYPRLLGFLT